MFIGTVLAVAFLLSRCDCDPSTARATCVGLCDRNARRVLVRHRLAGFGLAIMSMTFSRLIASH
jgi:hypothetical protein